MKIKFTDVNNEILSNVEIKILVSNIPETYITDNKGIVEFFEAIKDDVVICYIHEDDKQKFVYNEKNKPVIKLKAPLVDMIFVTVGDDEESVIGTTVYFEYNDQKLEKISDPTGQIILEKIPVNTEVKVYQLNKGEETNADKNKCKIDKAQYFISVDKYFDVASMKVKLVDKNGQLVRNADIRFRVEENEFESVTDQDGCVVVEEIKIGDSIECKQMVFGKSFPWHKFKCEEEIDEYILHGEKPLLYKQQSEKYESQVRVKFRLVNSKSLPIPNAVLELEYGEHVRHKYTNQYGEAMVDDILIGDKVKAFVDVRGNKTNAEFICQEDGELHEITLKTSKSQIYFWIIPMVIVIGLIVLFANADISFDFGNENNKDIEPQKDSVIIDKYSFQIVSDDSAQSAISAANVRLVYADSTFEKSTDDNGIIIFKALEGKLPKHYEISAMGYQQLDEIFKLSDKFNIALKKDSTISMSNELILCNNLVESPGMKTVINSFKMNLDKGRFKMWYNFFDLPIKMDVYNGTFQQISKDNLIFSTNDYLKGIRTNTIEFNSSDSIVTMKLNSNAGKSSWVYKVFCARRATEVIVQ